MDPGQIDISSYENREDEGTLLVHNAGEILYRLRSRSKNVSKQKRVNLR
jgi:hypothetical protein